MMKLSLTKDKIKILLLEGISQSTVNTLKEQGYNNIECLKGALNEDELIEKIKDVHILGIRSRTYITDKVLDKAKKLIAIGCFCIGTNQVDINACQNRGIPVFNSPFSNTRSVAELVLGEIIMLSRKVSVANANCHRGVWEKTAIDCHEVRGKTLGIVGYGHIGSQLSILAESLGLSVIFYDINKKLTLGNAKQVKSLEELVKKSDFVSLHVPEDKSTHHMINKHILSKFKNKSILINASRGNVVDLKALKEAIENKTIKGAALDVFPIEPASVQEEFICLLRGFDNVILTPHIGGSTIEAQDNIGIEVADKLVKYSDNGSTLSSVNFPQVSLPIHDSKQKVKRILHIHRNVPNVLSQINEVFAHEDANIVGQYLQTNSSIGYVVIDFTSKNSARSYLTKLNSIEHTIKSRLIF